MSKELRELQKDTLDYCIQKASETIPQEFINEDLQANLPFIMGWEFKINNLIDHDKAKEKHMKDLNEALELFDYMLEYSDEFYDEEVSSKYRVIYCKLALDAIKSITEMIDIFAEVDEEASEEFSEKLANLIGECSIDIDDLENVE
ncbi:MAG TPA: hypothetical protein VEF53_20750 [Patescibacteria group bacterium]|nr:hypothetical protein [Patescibacteria group bacterium]